MLTAASISPQPGVKEMKLKMPCPPEVLWFRPGLMNVLTAGAVSKRVDVYHGNRTDFISLSCAAHSQTYVKQQTGIDVIILDFMSWHEKISGAEEEEERWTGRLFSFITSLIHVSSSFLLWYLILLVTISPSTASLCVDRHSDVI